MLFMEFIIILISRKKLKEIKFCLKLKQLQLWKEISEKIEKLKISYPINVKIKDKAFIKFRECLDEVRMRCSKMRIRYS